MSEQHEDQGHQSTAIADQYADIKRQRDKLRREEKRTPFDIYAEAMRQSAGAEVVGYPRVIDPDIELVSETWAQPGENPFDLDEDWPLEDYGGF